MVRFRRGHGSIEGERRVARPFQTAEATTPEAAPSFVYFAKSLP